MKHKLLKGVSVLAVAGGAGAGIFKYCESFAVDAKCPKIPGFIQKNMDDSMMVSQFSEQFEECYNRVQNIPFRVLTVQSNDGYDLKARLYLPEDPKRIIIMMHGFRSSWKDDFVCLVEPLLAEGCILLMPDERAHNLSGGPYITYGAKEHEDCIIWANEAIKLRRRLPLYLWGMSMGATSVMLCADKKLPKRVKGIIADCGYDNGMKQLIYLTEKAAPLPAGPIVSLFRLRFKKKCDFDLKKTDTAKALAKSKLPILLFHGDEDTFVPPEASIRNLMAAKGDKRLVLIPGAGHCRCSNIDPETYLTAVKEFFADHK